MDIDATTAQGQAFIANHVDDRASVYEASIIKALADAEYPAADLVVLAAAASTLADWGGDLARAIRPVTEPSPSFLGRRADGLLLQYRAALVEAGNPRLIAERLVRWAAAHEIAAARHDDNAADYEGMAAGRRKHGNDDETAAELDRSAAGCRACAVTARELAAKHRARVGELTKREAA